MKLGIEPQNYTEARRRAPDVSGLLSLAIFCLFLCPSSFSAIGSELEIVQRALKVLSADRTSIRSEHRAMEHGNWLP